MGDLTGNATNAAPRRGRRWLWISLGLMTVLCGLPVAFVVWSVSFWDSAAEPEPVDCAETMAWAGATLPRSAEGARCTRTSWLDVQETAEFRMPRDEVEGWLAGTWPAGERRTYCGADVCLDVQEPATVPDPPAAVSVSVRWKDGNTALVRVMPFTV
ncbi:MULTISPECIES: hypothetical protein [Streptomyces]|uniref:Uncharacterized protein n=1 Tax=Streptomyces solicathayae TaxID=3081768 RepID=A0ABZ0LW99_9ACTN|nr:hypothetical protein [Streptomyces sp. HUAS YS2]WOX23069.1 hypothetical protein R2D22_17370 [Streptomyces sp. HUAS YS2]